MKLKSIILLLLCAIYMVSCKKSPFALPEDTIPGSVNPVTNLKAVATTEEKEIRITWKNPTDEALMKVEISVLPLPEHLQVSEQLTEDEMPKVHMKEIQVKLPKKEERGASFHEKSAKNSKVNVRVSYKDKMKKKYGKPKKRPGKK